MKNGNLATIDAAGRLVIPKAIREQASLKDGDRFEVLLRRGCIEIVPLPRAVSILRRGKVAVAKPTRSGPGLTEELVKKTIDIVRAGNG